MWKLNNLSTWQHNKYVVNLILEYFKWPIILQNQLIFEPTFEQYVHITTYTFWNSLKNSCSYTKWILTTTTF